MKKPFRTLLLGGCVPLGLALAVAGVMANEPATALLLEESPSCVQARLGRVSVHLGSREPNDRTGMAPASVSYRKAFAELVQAAEARGADAVVLRSHEADYVGKGARQPRRPTWLYLEGAAVRLKPPVQFCHLVIIDPAEFERRARAAVREDVQTDTGKSF
ncbi:hypothetical protein J2X04_000016 [Lysobacter niabensis]|uniref:Uncharacterized protein n=1 Tax=Agrilutibacter niabensis TaxID=380628 RepID=A0ABU1VJP5_9GAMM|nr:hypothetical protein [Lysobacter niabensis]MDR7097669.1 hypothetical protein [Lysobacter niabensis]